MSPRKSATTTDQSPAPLVRTEGEAAAILRSNARTLARWRSNGVGPRFIRIGRRVAYRDSDLNDFLDRQTRTSSAQKIWK